MGGTGTVEDQSGGACLLNDTKDPVSFHLVTSKKAGTRVVLTLSNVKNMFHRSRVTINQNKRLRFDPMAPTK